MGTTTEKGKSCDSKDENIKLECYGVRHTVALLCFLGYSQLTIMRNCLNVAIVKMALSYVLKANETYIDDKNNLTLFNETETGTVYVQNDVFDWDDRTIGIILGSFYYGYTVANAIGGRLADYWGAKYCFGIGVFLSSLITLGVPLSARISPYLLISIKLIHGIVDGLGFPGTSTIISKWIPNQERTKFTSYIYSGGSFGSIVSMALSGWICSSDHIGGWPAVFYVTGVMGVIWTIFWFALVSENPDSHPRISDDELIYIKKDLLSKPKEKLPAPWMDILTSKYFWIILFTSFGAKWCYYTIAIQLPSYLNNMLQINLKNNGFISALPFLGAWLFSVFYGYIVNIFSMKNFISTLSIRRISMVLGGYFPALGLLALAFLKCDAYVLIILFIISVSLIGAIHCGYFCSYTDIAPRFSGTLFGISSTFGGAAGSLSPLAASFFLENFELANAWELTFLTAAVIGGVTTTLYVTVITTEIQTWNEPKEKNIDKVKV